MRVEKLNDVSEVVIADNNKILAYVNNGVLYYSNRIYKKADTKIGLKEFDTLEQAEAWFGVSFIRPEDDNV